MAAVALVGSTGLIGSHVLSTLCSSSRVQNVNAFARKELTANPKLKTITAPDSATWPSHYPAGSDLFISALGTTRANAGGFENQRKIDYDLNLALAKSAKEAGTKAYVLVSSSGANPSSMLGYPKMKGELEEAVKEVGFDHLVILRPGLIVGERNESRAAEAVLRKVASSAGALSNKLKDFWAQDADVIAKAAIQAGLDCLDGKQQEKVEILGQADIVRLGRTEWKD